jgi:spore maturation protein SpmB
MGSSKMNKATEAVRNGFLNGLSTSWTLLKVMVPTILVVQVLKVTGLLGVLAEAAAPMMALFHLPGEASLVLITGGLVNIYAAIAVAVNIPLTAKGMTVLAVMVLIAHNLIVETAVQRKAGTPARIILPVRIIAALLAGLLFSRLIPEKGKILVQSGLPIEGGGWTDILAGNLLSLAKIVVIIVSLMILVELAREFGILDVITRALGPPMKLLGMDKKTSFVAAIGLVLGLAYGAGLIIDETRRSSIGRNEILATNIFLGTSHALIEDSLIFAAVGASLGWVVIGRLLFSAVFLKLSVPIILALWSSQPSQG